MSKTPTSVSVVLSDGTSVLLTAEELSHVKDARVKAALKAAGVTPPKKTKTPKVEETATQPETETTS